MNGHENIDPKIFFKIKTGRITRGHDFTLVKGQSSLDFRKYSFPQRTVNEWNKLPADCVHSSSVNTFEENRRQGRIHLDSYMWTLDMPTGNGFLVRSHLNSCLRLPVCYDESTERKNNFYLLTYLLISSLGYQSR